MQNYLLSYMLLVEGACVREQKLFLAKSDEQAPRIANRIVSARVKKFVKSPHGCGAWIYDVEIRPVQGKEISDPIPLCSSCDAA